MHNHNQPDYQVLLLFRCFIFLSNIIDKTWMRKFGVDETEWTESQDQPFGTQEEPIQIKNRMTLNVCEGGCINTYENTVFYCFYETV